MNETEKDLVIETVRQAYIEGIHRQSELELARQGFAEEFHMLINAGDKVDRITYAELLERVLKAKETNPNLRTCYVVEWADVTNDAAVVKVVLFRDGVYFFTDYLSLYKQQGQWRIVSKTYTKDPAKLNAVWSEQ